ncbi:MAG: hypothetical protein QOH51_459 [Acidobacteriota bacterium]|jgi:hypothetical protein|nr:hypothetical protein [Acidobacteriota bacterium]
MNRAFLMSGFRLQTSGFRLQPACLDSKLQASDSKLFNLISGDARRRLEAADFVDLHSFVADA